MIPRPRAKGLYGGTTMIADSPAHDRPPPADRANHESIPPARSSEILREFSLCTSRDARPEALVELSLTPDHPTDDMKHWIL